jgi:hypothetical protein
MLLSLHTGPITNCSESNENPGGVSDSEQMEELGGEFDREASGNSQYKITSEGDVNNDFG